MKIKTPLFDIKIDIIFLIFMFIFFISSRVRNYFNSFIICYLFIVFHESSHMLVGALLGKEIDNLNIGIFGVNVSFRNNHYEKYLQIETKKEIINNILMYIAGPISNFILAFVFYKIKIVFEINIFLGILNLIPIFPLDGYNILKSILKLWINNDNLILKVINIVNYALLCCLLIIAIAMVFKLYNPSLFLFLIYLIILKSVNLKHRNKTRYYK